MRRRLPWLICASACAVGAAQAQAQAQAQETQEAIREAFVAEFRLPVRGMRVEAIGWRAGGDIFVSRSTLETLGIAAPAGDPVRLADVAGLSWRENTREAAIEITCAAACFAAQTIAAQETIAPMTASETGAFLNVDLSAARIGGRGDAGGALEFGVFSPAGAGEFTGFAREDEAFVRLETRWTLDFPDTRVRARFGDSITRGGATGASVRFGGLQIARDFTLDPGFIAFPLPTLSGSAQTPSVVDLYVDGALSLRERVEAGPFSIPNAPVFAGGGVAEVVVTDALGRESVIAAPFYAGSDLLRPGLSDFSFSLGVLRSDFGAASANYGDAFASGFYRVGVTDWATAEARGDIARDYASGGAGVSFQGAAIGQIDLGYAYSVAESRDGARVRIGWRRATRAISFGVEAEKFDAGYATLGDAAGFSPPRVLARAFVSTQTNFGSLGLSGTWRDAREAADVRTLSLSYAPPPSSAGSWSINALYVDDGEPFFSIGIGFAVALDGDVALGAGAEFAGGDLTARASINRPAPLDGGIGWRASGAYGARERADVGALIEGAYGEARFEASHAGGAGGARAQYAGGLVWIDGDVYAGRPVRESFALVDAGAPNVGVLRENRRVAETDARGRALIANLRAYEPNRISIALDDLPIEAVAARDAAIVRPAARAGVRVTFGLRLGSGEARVVDAHGAPLPAGAILVRRSDGARFPVGRDGRIYVTGMQGEEAFTLEGGTPCETRVSLQNRRAAVCG